jgi:hypothetical protein
MLEATTRRMMITKPMIRPSRVAILLKRPPITEILVTMIQMLATVKNRAAAAAVRIRARPTAKSRAAAAAKSRALLSVKNRVAAVVKKAPRTAGIRAVVVKKAPRTGTAGIQVLAAGNEAHGNTI